MADAPVIVWFRQDLRLADNPALSAALETGRPLVALYVLDERSPGVRPLGGASRWWLHHSLAALSQDLGVRGVSLILREGPAGEVVREVAQEAGAAAVHWNRCYEPAAVQRDKALKAALREDGVSVESFNGSLLIEPWQVETGQGGPYKVFTPFWKAIRDRIEPGAAHPLPDGEWAAAPVPATEALDDWSLLPGTPDWAGGLRAAWTPGEAGAQASLATFLDEAVAAYPNDRDRPDRAGTSRLSPCLHWGEIGPNQVWRATAELLDKGGATAKGAEAFLRELAWRDFNHHLLFHFPQIVTENWKPAFDDFPWRDDPEGRAAWEAGRTGYPVVDAGMRELWETGWMHNRVRMIAASFLIKDLMIDWRVGEAWFWDTLVDASLANNVANWQWVAGCGADAAPFFRIFNPVTQGEKFDPDGAYVRRWVPEIADRPDGELHAPRAGRDYPGPVVGHKPARERALAAYKALDGG